MTLSKKHYETIAKVLRETYASTTVVEGFVDIFKKDNPRFKPNLFRNAAETDCKQSERKQAFLKLLSKKQGYPLETCTSLKLPRIVLVAWLLEDTNFRDEVYRIVTSSIEKEVSDGN